MEHEAPGDETYTYMNILRYRCVVSDSLRFYGFMRQATTPDELVTLLGDYLKEKGRFLRKSHLLKVAREIKTASPSLWTHEVENRFRDVINAPYALLGDKPCDSDCNLGHCQYHGGIMI